MKYRLQVYESYRHDRRQYGERMSVGQRVLAAWNDEANRVSDQTIVDWFTAARLATLNRSELPPFHVPTSSPSSKARRATAGPRNRRLGPKIALRKQATRPASPAIRFTDPPVDNRVRAKKGATVRAVPHKELAHPKREKVPQSRRGLVVASSSVGSNREDPSNHNFAIDLQLLSARVRAFNLRLQDVESRLAEPGELNSTELSEMVEELEGLLADHRTYLMYWNLLSSGERSRVASCQPVDSVVATMARRLQESEHAAQTDQNQTEIDHLRTLSRRIKSWQTN
jgi:hypothetical protein